MVMSEEGCGLWQHRDMAESEVMLSPHCPHPEVYFLLFSENKCANFFLKPAYIKSPKVYNWMQPSMQLALLRGWGWGWVVGSQTEDGLEVSPLTDLYVHRIELKIFSQLLGFCLFVCLFVFLV